MTDFEDFGAFADPLPDSGGKIPAEDPDCSGLIGEVVMETLDEDEITIWDFSAVAVIDGAEVTTADSVAVPRSSYSSLPEENPEDDTELDSKDDADCPLRPGREIEKRRIMTYLIASTKMIAQVITSKLEQRRNLWKSTKQ